MTNDLKIILYAIMNECNVCYKIWAWCTYMVYEIYDDMCNICRSICVNGIMREICIHKQYNSDVACDED